jgi:hypothetical protein
MRGEVKNLAAAHLQTVAEPREVKNLVAAHLQLSLED